jgi:hypothetical protein
MRKPLFKRTYELYKRLGAAVGFGSVAKISGVCTDTADDWAREAPSDDNPFATGKKNTTDTVMRQIAMAHKTDAGLAREWSNVFPTYVDYLDTVNGVTRAHIEQNPLCSIIGESAKEHLDIVLEYMNNGGEIDFDKLERETVQALAKLNELLACIRERAKVEVRHDYTKRNYAAVTIN